jgi:hypothetical protein
MKSPWVQTLAWIAAVVAASLFAWAAPDESSIERMSSPHFDMQFRASP